MLKAKLKNHYLKKKLNQFSQTKESSTVSTNQKIKTVGIITSETFFQKYNFSDILLDKLQLRNPKIYSYRKFSKDHKKSYFTN